MHASDAIAYRSWGRSLLVWLLTNGLGWVAQIALPAHEDELVGLIALFAAVGTLPLLPVIRQWLAEAAARPQQPQRLGRAWGFATLLFAGAVLLLSVLTGGLGFFGVLFGGWVYLPAAWAAVALSYGSWLWRADGEVAG